MPKLSWKLRAGESQRSTEIDNEEGQSKREEGGERSWRSQGQRRRPALGALGRRPSGSVSPASARPPARAPRPVSADSHGRTAEPLSQLLPVGGFGAAREVPSFLRREGRNRTVQITGHDRDGPLGAAGTSPTLQRKRARGFGLPSVAYK